MPKPNRQSRFDKEGSMSTRIVLGPQGEVILEARDVAVDGPGFAIPAKKADSSVTSGTDREQAVKKFAASIVRGPQGEIIRPVCEEGICPLCQQSWPESCSQPGEDLDPRAPVETEDDPDNFPADDRDNMMELLK